MHAEEDEGSSLCPEEENAPDISMTPVITSTGPIFRLHLILKLFPLLIRQWSHYFVRRPLSRYGMTVIACLIDFWFTQKIVGPLVFGIRRFPDVTDDHRSRIVIETIHRGSQNRSVFAFVIAATPVIWGWRALMWMRTGWLPVELIAFVLSFANAWIFCNWWGIVPTILNLIPRTRNELMAPIQL
jgi:hypothetical protein